MCVAQPISSSTEKKPSVELRNKVERLCEFNKDFITIAIMRMRGEAGLGKGRESTGRSNTSSRHANYSSEVTR